MSYWLVVADYRPDGLKVHGVFSTAVRAKAEAFDLNLYGCGRVIPIMLDTVYPDDGVEI